jgi:hypothetical protein
MLKLTPHRISLEPLEDCGKRPVRLNVDGYVDAHAISLRGEMPVFIRVSAIRSRWIQVRPRVVSLVGGSRTTCSVV